jgi:hypothetical protein
MTITEIERKLKDSFLKYWEVEELRTAKESVKVSDFMYYILTEMKTAPETMKAEAASKYGDKKLTNKQWSDFAKGWMWCKYSRLERIVGNDKIQAAKNSGFITVSEFKQYGRYTKEVYITRKGVRLMADKFNFNPDQIGR